MNTSSSPPSREKVDADVDLIKSCSVGSGYSSMQFSKQIDGNVRKAGRSGISDQSVRSSKVCNAGCVFSLSSLNFL